ncbi:hypothetical protein [Variovorax boronicumulans]|uniref:hypothetical protein n=1 Tax=Variovorax boronicumulans TaxID=436515 RepID=UPI001F0A0ACC|nr:hypothetical protein [Variovorax boronicumulans]
MLIEQLQSGVASRTLMLGFEGGSVTQRAEVSRAVGKAMRDSQLFDLVQNGDVSDWSEAGTWVFQHRYQLSSGVMPGQFTAEGLREAIVDTLSMLGTPAGNAIKPLLDSDPTGETQRIAMELVPASAPRSEAGVWMSREAPRALMIATTRAAGGDLDAQAVAIARVQAAYEAAARGMGEAAPKLLLSGPPCSR